MPCKITLRTTFCMFLSPILCCYIASCSTNQTTAAKSPTKTGPAQITLPNSEEISEDTSEVIIRWQDKKLTLQQITWMHPATDDKTIARAADWWLENELLYAEAERRGITQEPRAKFIAELMRKKAIAGRLTTQVRDAVKISDQQVRDYYEKHKQTDPMLVQPGYLSFSHIRTSTLEQAQAALERIKAGEDINALARELSIDGDAKDGGVVKKRRYNEVRRYFGTRFFDSINDANQGDLIGPVKVKGNVYEIARQEGKIEPKPLPFEEVQARLKSNLLRRERRDAANNLAELLKEKAAGEIVKSPRLIDAEKSVSETSRRR